MACRLGYGFSHKSRELLAGLFFGVERADVITLPRFKVPVAVGAENAIRVKMH